MRISVVVTAYEKPGYLRKVLAGFLCQRRPPDEIVVADDGSGPAIAAVVTEFERRAPFPVIHAWQEKKGFRLAAARNLGVRRSSGDYLVFVDDDCVPAPWFVSDHARLAHRGWYVQGKRIFVEAKAVEGFTGREDGLSLFRLWVAGGLKKLHLVPHLAGLAVERRGGRGVRGCNMAVFRRDLYRVNGWNEKFISWGREDSELAIRLQRAGIRRRDALFSAVVFHLDHGKSARGISEENERLLREARTAPVFTPEGLVRREPSCV